METAQAIWDFLLSAQEQKSIAGDFVEIGVFMGKSALLGAQYLAKTETAILIDTADVSVTVRQLESLTSAPVINFTGRSSLFRATPPFTAHAGRVRWFHIDGDHSGYATWNDLCLAADMISAQGIICVDDFENFRYPQLIAAVYRFLFAHPEFRMFLIGGNKAFICHTENYAIWEGMVRNFLPASLRQNGITASITKTSYTHDFGCFAICPRQHDRDLIGRDEDLDDVVF